MASSRAQRSVRATRRENYKTLVGQIDVLDPEKIDHEILVLEKMKGKVYVALFVSTSSRLIWSILNLRQEEEKAFLTN